MTDGILLHVEDGLARVTFDRPASLNAMDFPMARRWREVAHEVTSDPAVGAVILDANGPAFCAGGDVVAMSTTGAAGSDVTETAHAIHEGIRTFAEAPLPMVAAVQGAVAGGGLGLMLTAERRALQLLLQDRMLTAAEAMDWGLVAEVVASADLVTRVDEIARFWLEGATAAFGQATRLVRVGAARTLAENLDDEAATIGAAFETPEARARVAAFAAASAKGQRS